MELGLLPGTRVQMVRVAPLGDPVELLVRGCRLSIRRAEAAAVRVHANLAGARVAAESELAFADAE
jgi:Fe2+ transport system protein FeoA